MFIYRKHRFKLTYQSLDDIADELAGVSKETIVFNQTVHPHPGSKKIK